MIYRFSCLLTLLFILLVFAGCASQPVLYPNKYYQTVGKEKAKRDIAAALAKARALGLEENTSRNHKQLARSVSDSAVDCGTRTAVDAVTGSAGIGSAASMASGGIKAFFRWLLWSSKPNMHYRKFVNNDLKAQGYQVVGWD